MEMSRDAGSIPAASTFHPWCHPVPGTDKEDENPCYRRGFFMGGGEFHGHPVAHEANLTISGAEGAVFVARVI